MTENAKSTTQAAKTTKKRRATKATAKPAARPAKARVAKQVVSPVERWTMVAKAAYYRAQERGFMTGNPMDDWLEAEKDIDAQYEVDLGRVMTILDPTEMMDQFTKAIGGHNFPGVDLSAVLESQRKNFEALVAANKVVFEGAQDVTARQTQALRDALAEVTGAVKDVASAGSPTAAAAKQGELVKQAMEKALANMREVTHMATAANTEAFNTISIRVAESLDELKKLAKELGSN